MTAVLRGRRLVLAKRKGLTTHHTSGVRCSSFVCVRAGAWYRGICPVTAPFGHFKGGLLGTAIKIKPMTPSEQIARHPATNPLGHSIPKGPSWNFSLADHAIKAHCMSTRRQQHVNITSHHALFSAVFFLCCCFSHPTSPHPTSPRGSGRS